MPFKSKAQQRFMFAKHPKMAKRWAHETPDIKALPEKLPEKKEKAADDLHTWFQEAKANGECICPSARLTTCPVHGNKAREAKGMPPTTPGEDKARSKRLSREKSKKASTNLLAQMTIAMNAFELSGEGREKTGMHSATLGSFFDELEKIAKDLTTTGRKHVKEENFALPGRRYPIHDESHARNALARVAQHGTPAEQSTVRAAVAKKWPGIGKTAGIAGTLEKTVAKAIPKPVFKAGVTIPLPQARNTRALTNAGSRSAPTNAIRGARAAPAAPVHPGSVGPVPGGAGPVGSSGTHVRPGTQVQPRSPGQGGTKVNTPRAPMQAGASATPNPPQASTRASSPSPAAAAPKKRGLMGTLALGGGILGAGAMVGHALPQQQQQQAY